MSALAASAPRTLPRRAVQAVVTLLTLATAAALLLVAPHPADATGRHAPSHSRTVWEMAVGRVVLARLNLERSWHHLAPLRMNNDLLASARRHDVTMAYYNQMSHQLPHEPYFATRMSQCGYKWSWAAENIAWNSDMSTQGVVALENMMYGERPPNDGHRQNILNPHLRDAGIDVYVDDQNHKIWLTEDLGRR